MRYLPLLCCLLASPFLNAQSDDKPKNGWEISASFAPDLRQRTQLSGVRIETDPNDIPIAQRPRQGFDTINIAGQDRIFSLGNSFNFDSKPVDSDFWFGASVNAHRRIGLNFDFSAGLFFSQSNYTTGVDDEVTERSIVNTSSPIIFNLEEVSQRTFGLTVRGHYHLFPEKRLHPYFGMGVNVYRNLRDRLNTGQIYLGESAVILPLTSPPAAVSSDRVDFDFVATAGLLFRVSETWSVGLDITNRLVNGPGLIGLQVRRRL